MVLLISLAGVRVMNISPNPRDPYPPKLLKVPTRVHGGNRQMQDCAASRSLTTKTSARCRLLSSCLNMCRETLTTP